MENAKDKSIGYLERDPQPGEIMIRLEGDRVKAYRVLQTPPHELLAESEGPYVPGQVAEMFRRIDGMLSTT